MWNPFSRRPPSPPTDQDRALAAQLLETAQRLLGSTSSGRSSANSSPRPLPPDYRKRGAEDVVIVSRERRVELEWETRRAQLPKAVRDPDPVSPDQQSSGKALTGGFAVTIDVSPSTAPEGKSEPGA